MVPFDKIDVVGKQIHFELLLELLLSFYPFNLQHPYYFSLELLFLIVYSINFLGSIKDFTQLRTLRTIKRFDLELEYAIFIMI